MEKIHLDIATGSPVDSRDAVLLRALRGLRDSHHPYQFNLYDPRGHQYFVLSTTHKDTFLSLGKLDEPTRLMLCMFFVEAYQRSKDPEMVFTYEPAFGEKKTALHVVRSEGINGPGTLIFHLSPIY